MFECYILALCFGYINFYICLCFSGHVRTIPALFAFLAFCFLKVLSDFDIFVVVANFDVPVVIRFISVAANVRAL